MRVKTWSGIVAGMLLAVVPMSAQTTSCDGDTYNCFLLRTAAADAATVIAAHALTEVVEVKSGDPVLKMVTGPTNTLPETTLSALQGDPLVLGAELVIATADTESASPSARDTSDPNLQTAVNTTGTYSGPETVHYSSPVWKGFMEQPLVAQAKIDAAHADPRPEAMGLGIVAVIDTGVDPSHKALQGALIAGYDFLTETAGIASEWNALNPATAASDETDLRNAAEQSYATVVEQSYATVVEQSYATVVEQSYATVVENMGLPKAFGHGTMVAGLVRLVAPGAKIMPLRVFDGDGNGNLGDIIRAIYYAVDNGADVINMSFSVSTGSPELLAAIGYASQNGVVLVSSVGNDDSPALTQPSMYADVVGVASIDGQNLRSAFSNFALPLVELAAPGEAVITTFPGDCYAAAWGTSFSSALVAGTIALMHDDTGNGNYTAIDWLGAKAALDLSSLTVSDPKINKRILDVDHAMNCGLSGGTC